MASGLGRACRKVLNNDIIHVVQIEWQLQRSKIVKIIIQLHES